MGYVSILDRGYYIITDLGRKQICLPKISKDMAKKILRTVPDEKAFHFYTDIGKPLGVSSNSLIDFCERIKSLKMESIKFHMTRGDFELWIHYLGDAELAKRLRIIREAGLSGKELRNKLYNVIKSRCEELMKIAAQ